MSGRGRSERVATATAAVQRAWLALAALETARTSEDVDRARHGAQHELETALRVLGAAVPEPPPPSRKGIRGRTASMIIVDDPLPFPEPPHLTEAEREAQRIWWENTPTPRLPDDP